MKRGYYDMFRKKANTKSDLPRACEFCEHATIIHDDANVLCERHGIVSREYACKRFSYDPLKRVPRALPTLPKLSEEDLLL